MPCTDGVDEKDDASLSRLPLTHLSVHEPEDLPAIIRAHPKLEQLNVINGGITTEVFDAFDLGLAAATHSTTERARLCRPLAALRFHLSPRSETKGWDAAAFARTCPDMRMFVCHAKSLDLSTRDVLLLLKHWKSLELLDLGETIGKRLDGHTLVENIKARRHVVLVYFNLFSQEMMNSQGRPIRYRIQQWRNFGPPVDKIKPTVHLHANVSNMLHDLWL